MTMTRISADDLGALRHPDRSGHPGRSVTSRKDPSVYPDVRVVLPLAQERQAREHDVAALERRQPRTHRSVRRRLGQSLVRFGRWLAAEPSTPAWTG